MFRSFKCAILFAHFLCVCSLSLSQDVELVYRERKLTLGQSPLLFMHGQSSTIYLAVSRVGVFTLNGQTLSPTLVEGTAGADGYEYQYLGECTNGDYLLHQRGFLGDRIFRLDGMGRAHQVNVADGKVRSVFLQGNGSAIAIVEASPDVYQTFISVDCAQTWFADGGGRRVQSMGGALLLEQNEPFRHVMARSGLGNRTYPSAIKSRETYGLRSAALLGSDSVVWISAGKRANMPDTLWYADIRDSSRKRYDTTLRIDGLADTVELSDMQLLGTHTGLVVLGHRSGWYARYDNGDWSVVDTLPGISSFGTSSNVSIRNNLFQYISSYATGQRLVTVFIDSTTNSFRTIDLDPAPSDLWSLSALSADCSSLAWSRPVNLLCLYSEAGGMQLINSVVGEIDVLKATPIQYGFTNEHSEPIVVPYSDCIVLVPEGGVGILKALDARGEKWSSPTRYGPRIQSTQGLRTPYIGNNEVLSPGDRVRQFTRSGSFVKTLSTKTATSVLRHSDSTVIIASGPTITCMRPNNSTDSFDITSALCTNIDTAGYINSLIENEDGSILAFVNGVRLLDLETFESSPLRCGGVLRSLDTGRTWTRCAVPVESPYFLGSVRTSTGALVASVSTLVRDTTLQTPEDEAPPLESKNHSFSDRVVIRSVDNGTTWTQVYFAPSSGAFLLVGGDGVITKDGTLLLMTTDGVLKSTNDGLEWDFHDPVGMDAGAQIISMFQDTVGSPVYYCTTVGLYKEQPVTDVHDDQQRSRPQIHTARAWYDHVSYWKRSGMEVKRLFSVLGVEMPLTDPPPGLYVAECVTESGVRVEPILVVSE